MKVLVTGGLGFIGSNFCRHLTREDAGFEVLNVDKIGTGANTASLKDLNGKNTYSFVQGDICDSKLMNKLVRRADAIVNMAAETHVDRSILDPNLFVQNNTLGTLSILEALRKTDKKTRLIQVSTDEVYGQAEQGSFKEEQTLMPSNPYSASKAAADMLVMAYHRTYGLNAMITRCTNNFGPYQFPEKFIPKTIIRGLKGLPIPVYGSGKNVRDWIYVQDHCEAILSVLKKGKPGEVYNVSSGNELSNIEVARRILSLIGKSEELLTFVEDRPGHDLRYSLDSSKIMSALNWKPKFAFKDRLEATVDWYSRNKWWWGPLANANVLSATPWKPSDTK
jgi:dTDP-glucose 4,6-dehydratase